MTETMTAEHEEGRPWNIEGRFATYDEAHWKREELMEQENLQVKVKWMRKRDDFVVKTRDDPSVMLAEESALRREEKRRRKKKLNKKRRKR